MLLLVDVYLIITVMLSFSVSVLAVTVSVGTELLRKIFLSVMLV